MIKGSFDDIRNFLAGFCEGDNVDLLIVQKQRLDELCHEWDRNYVKLNILRPGTYKKVFVDYSELYFTLMADILTLIEDRKTTKFSIGNSNKSVDVKLPDIVLSRFGGNVSGNTIVKQASQSCICCKGEHALYQCPDFKALNVQKRKELISLYTLCSRCIASRHGISECKFRFKCSICKEPHNTLLHEKRFPPSTITVLI